MQLDPNILYGKVCPYCYQTPKLIDSKHVYGTSYGLIHFCENCNAFVGCHKGSNKPLGRLADAKLRYWKKQAHFYFDYLWKKKAKKEKISQNKARNKGYKWLSKKLGLPKKYTHIGMFDVEFCKKVVEICKPYYK